MNCSSETVKMGEPDRHASPPGNRLKAEPMADGQGEAGTPISAVAVTPRREWLKCQG